MISIITAIQTIFRPLFKDLSTWRAWIVFLKALFALPMNEEELALYRQCTGRQNPPEQPFREAWVPAGVRSGKSFIAALIAVFLACFFNYRPHLSAGEIPHILILAADRAQAQVILRYIKAFLTQIPVLSQLVKREVADGVDLEVPFEENGKIQISPVAIRVATCSFRSVRGFTASAVICDEIAFWRDDSAANPATEVLRALRPRMATIPNSLLFCISSPYSRSGPLYQAFKDHYGVDGSDVLCWKAPTRVMNPTISQKLIDKHMESDPEAARAEWDAEFRSDLEAFLSIETIEAVTVRGRRELPPLPNTYYRAFVDPSGGRGDAAALAISHRDKDRVVLDLARRWTAPHDPAVVVGEMAAVLRGYGITQVTGDRYAGAWPEKEFLKHKIIYTPSSKDKSAIYLELLPMVLSGRVELVENKTLFSELRALERRTRSTGRDLVDHPPKGHDDLANAAAGACVLVSECAGGEISYQSIERRRFGRDGWESEEDRRGDREDIPFTRRERGTAW